MSPISFYRNLVIVNGAVPLCILAWDAYRGQLGANSVNYALHVTGILSLVFLFLSLVVTPLRWITNWSGWIAFRRSLGLFGFFYAILHVAIYVGFDRSLSLASTLEEIWMRRFLQVGTAAVFLMVPLAFTSTNGMIQKLGPKRWKLLHRLTYVVAVLGVVHYYMLVKSDVRQPVAFGVVLLGLLGSRFGRHYVELLKNAKGGPQGVVSEGNSADQGKRQKYWSGELKLAAIFQETSDVRTFRFIEPAGGALPFEYLPGQYMNLQLHIDGGRVNRSYTIASTPTRRDSCELSIKREPLGTASRYMHNNLKVGDMLKVSAPAGKFYFTGSQSQSVLMIAGGVGITPLMSMVRYLTDKVWNGDIYFIIIAKTENDIIFRDEIDYLKGRFPRLHVCITLTRTESQSMWMGERGRATAGLLQRFVPNLNGIPVYLCGPNKMMDATCELLLSMGVPKESINTEAFVSPGIASVEAASDSPVAVTGVDDIRMSGIEDSDLETGNESNTLATISFARSNLDIEVSTGTSILEAAETLSIDLPFECRSGICGQCRTKLLKGRVSMETEEALTATELVNGFVLACQAHPRTNIVVDA